ncbi:hypothetical protein N0V82_000233 [Gnomoniopsis sp. IMI 355080]|nr:hypothetical protein N0V82_000233 [Gnomoniopsis sp. IMI 355080]
MKLRRTLNFHSLRKGKVRMTWNKYNLFNLTNVQRTIPNFIRRTFFQQKWTAKALARAYHGEHIKEQKWQRMFDRRLRSVVDMNPKYMAHNDGAEQATGRGSGRDTPRAEDVTPWRAIGQDRQFKLRGGLNKVLSPVVDKTEVDFSENDAQTYKQTNIQESQEPTPYMNMSFAPIERRIDVAIFRAMFASSTRQARNMVIHGKVKVNGLPMNHATYLLNPGDMFQVDPEAVMFATGKIKPKSKKPEEEDSGTPRPKMSRRSKRKAKAKAAGDGEATEDAAAAPEADEGSLEPAEGEEAEAEAETTANKVSPEDTPEALQKRLRFLARNSRDLLQADQNYLSVKKKRQMRAFLKQAKEISSKLGRKDGEGAITDDLVTTISNTLKELAINDPKIAERAVESGAFTPEQTAEAKEAAESDTSKTETSETKLSGAKVSEPAPSLPKPYQLSDEEQMRLEEMVREYEENPVDPTKPYKTPWEPRPFMSPFAFIPRYLEVNQNICAAVYLRHPVARQGMSEIPSPFPPSVQELAFNWYLRRR